MASSDSRYGFLSKKRPDQKTWAQLFWEENPLDPLDCHPDPQISLGYWFPKADSLFIYHIKTVFFSQ